MKITGVIWLTKIVEKLDWKHNVQPEEMTIAEASAFWDKHSVANSPSHIVEMEYDPDSDVTIIAVAAELREALKARAENNGVTIETLVNLWIQEKLQSAE